MAMTQGKNDINLYWNDKNNKEKNFYFLTVFIPLFALVLGYTATPGLCTISTTNEITLNKIPKRRCGNSPHSAQTKQYYYMTTTLQLQVNKDTLDSTLKSIGNQYDDTVVLYDDYKQHE